MKKYTHAWLAMMAMKRIEKADIPAKHKEDAAALVKWFKDYRDFVISGAWYPDSVFKDMGTSHILKYVPDAKSKDVSFRVMPPTLQLYQMGLSSPMYMKPFTIKSGNLCDRCESFTESLVDSFKILESEGKGEPIVPSCNHTAMRFFILSHYIADCHMPLHCDARSISAVHAFIEEQWDNRVRASYQLDEANNRFFYDPAGYPLVNGSLDPLMKAVETDLVKREFIWDWGKGCGNTWDYMSGVSQYSYLMAYRLVPADRPASEITKKWYMTTEAYTEHFDEYSTIILSDAVDSIAKVWLHAWVRYRSWLRGRELAELKEKARNAEKAHKKAVGKESEDVVNRLKALADAATIEAENKEKDNKRFD